MINSEQSNRPVIQNPGFAITTDKTSTQASETEGYLF